MPLLIPLHVAAGGLAMLLGALALAARKGGPLHRRSGQGFVHAMLAMGATASILEYLKAPSPANGFAALLVAYLVGTAVTTVRPATAATRRLDVAALVLALVLSALAALGGLSAIGTPGLTSGGVPFRTVGVMSLFIAAIVALAAWGDLRVLRHGAPTGGARLSRHLWRMCFALFIAAGSFFSIRERVAKVLPDPLTTGPVRALPILVVFGAMFYWLWRVRGRRPLPTRTE